MNESDKLEDCKKEIRSILIPYQRGCLLSEFNKAYRELIGKRLPIKDFGFRADIEFLYSIPDVVNITPTRTGEYHLMAVADEKSIHIQKMVAKQKPSKTKATARIYKPPKSSFQLPPRFAETNRKYYGSSFKDTSKVSRHKSQPILEPKPPERVSKKPEKVNQIPPRFEPKLLPKSSPKEEVIELVKYFDNQILFNDLLSLYQRMYQKELSLSTYGFSSLEECISEIPELDIENKDKYTYIVYSPESSEAPVVNQSYSIQDNSALPSDKETHQSMAQDFKGGFCSETKEISQVPSTFLSEMYNNQNSDKVYVPDSLKRKLEMVGEKYTRGILSSVFSYCFEEVTGTPLDIQSLGYRCLSDLIDSVPDIFMRERVFGSKKDFIIYAVKKQTSELNGKKVVHHVIVNLRRILQAYPEGIELNDFLHIYSINCNDTLCIKDFGFDDLETFLSSIKNQVPLKISSSTGVKIVHMLQDGASSSHSAGSETSQEENIPFDAAPPGYRFKPQPLPDNFDFSKYFPVYTSSVCHPGHLYIQIQGEDTADALVMLTEKIESFYNGKDSSRYIMQNIHINVGASCVALWPTDGHWYRAVITSVVNMEEVKVHYVDYGTKDKIHKSNLRYLKKEFADLPAQALRCRLAFLKPANHATMWNAAALKRILNLCEDISLMAKIEDIDAGGVYSIILCDTNGDEDVYINDVLCNEGLADYANRESPVASQPEPVIYNHNLNPLLALQAQYYLQAFITVAPSFANNENYINLMREVSMCCAKPELGRPDKDMSSAATLVPPGFSAVPTNATAYVNSTLPTFNMVSPQSNSSLRMERKFNISNVPTLVSSDDSETFMSVKTAEGENGEPCEIFDDDDDEDIFQEFCQKVTLEPVRHVKRVLLGEGYKIHIIVVKSKPYVSSDDVSRLIWSNKEDDYLFRRLQLQDVEIPNLTLSESGNEELFQQLEKFCVKGIQKMDGLKSRILLHPLRVVIKILNIFGHPSITLRTKLIEEIAHFDPDDPEWTNFSLPEPLEQEEGENLSGVTDDDKIEKLCLFDLLAMKESITFRRKKLEANLRSRGNDIKCDEMDKLEQLHQKVLQRIQEIKEICSVFS